MQEEEGCVRRKETENKGERERERERTYRRALRCVQNYTEHDDLLCGEAGVETCVRGSRRERRSTRVGGCT